MSVRIVRLKSGEDVISDIYEVTSNAEKEEDKQPVAYQLRFPFTIWINGGMEAEVDGEIQKLSDPEVAMEQWLPLCKHDHIFLKLDEVTAAYETHDSVIEQYTKLIEAKMNGEREANPPEGEE
tara:strand:+ start:926 stop:1294 length:369 start_codon:yes stop_codon:yes gene_type:complete